MKSIAAPRFWRLFEELPAPIQELAVKSYHLWLDNPNHPSLHFRRLQGTDDRFTIRVGDHHRALGHLRDGTITWVWIGTRAEYDRWTRSDQQSQPAVPTLTYPSDFGSLTDHGGSNGPFAGGRTRNHGYLDGTLVSLRQNATYALNDLFGKRRESR